MISLNNKNIFIILCLIILCLMNSLIAHEGIIDTGERVSLQELWKLVIENLNYEDNRGINIRLDGKLYEFLGLHPAIVILAVEEFNRLYPSYVIPIQKVRLLVLGSILEDWNIDWETIKNFHGPIGFENLGKLPDALHPIFYSNANSKLNVILPAAYWSRCFSHFLTGGCNQKLSDLTSISIKKICN